MADLTHNTWTELVKVAGVLSDGRVEQILKEHLGGLEGMGLLSEEQAQSVLGALRPLPGIRNVLYQAAVRAIEQGHLKLSSSELKPMAKVQPDVVAELITQVQIDELAAQFVLTQVDTSLFDSINK